MTHANDLTLGQMTSDVLDLVVGGSAVLLPAFILAVPCIVLCVVPLLVVGAAVAVIGGVLAAPVLLVRAVGRAVSSRSWPAGTT
jgi:hypothetical protein